MLTHVVPVSWSCQATSVVAKVRVRINSFRERTMRYIARNLLFSIGPLRAVLAKAIQSIVMLESALGTALANLRTQVEKNDSNACLSRPRFQVALHSTCPSSAPLFTNANDSSHTNSRLSCIVTFAACG